MPQDVLTTKSLNLDVVLASADTQTRLRGQEYHRFGLARIQFVEAQEAQVKVRGSRPRPYEVDVVVERGRSLWYCDCPVGGDADGPCKHMVAAALTLSEFLKGRAPASWEAALSAAMTVAATRKTPTAFASSTTAKSLLVFSLQKRSSSGTGWAIYPFSLPVRHFPEEALTDPEAIAAIVKKEKLGDQAQSVRSRVDARRFANLTDDLRLVAQMAAMSQQFGYYYYGDRALSYEALFPRLAGQPVFLGNEKTPLQQPIQVVAQPGAAAIALEAGEDGHLRLGLEAGVNGETLRLSTSSKTPTQIINEDPLWLLSGKTLFPLETADPLLTALLRTSADEMLIPAEDRAAFVERYLLPLAQRVPLRGSGIEWETREAGESAPEPRLYLSEIEGALRAHLRFAYGEEGGEELPFDKGYPAQSVQRAGGEEATEEPPPLPLKLLRIERRPEAEEQAYQTLGTGFGLKRGTEPGEFALRARTDPVDFLLHQVPRLAEAGYTVFGEEALASARVNRNRPTLRLSVSSGIDWFDVQAVVEFGDLKVPLAEIRKAVRKREHYIKLADGSIGAIPQDWIERYRHLFALGQENEDGGLRLAPHHLTLLDAAMQDDDPATTATIDAEFARRRDRLKNFTQITDRPIPAGFVGELRPYQKAGFDWLHFLKDYEFGGCLADDMGTGKTIQTLAFLQSLREEKPDAPASLLVLPRSLLFNWQREAARFAPNLRLREHSGTDRATDIAAFDNTDLVLTTYGVLLRDIDLLRKYRFQHVILDEAQAVKNPVAQTARAARLLQADHRLALTGTPVENNTLELWSLFAFLNPGLLGSLDYFREEFASAIEKRQDEDAGRLLRRIIHPFILRRTKDQVASDLPPRSERILYTEMEPVQRKLYEKTRDLYRARILGILDEGGKNAAHMTILEGLLRLRQISNHPRLVEHDSKAGSGKFDLLLETLETLRAEGHKALIFSQFVQMLSIVREALDERGIPYAYLDGRVKDRQARVDRFQNEPELPFFLISLKAGGVGLNLTEADYVLHIDPWWNPAVEMQATDRAHRIGQTRPVFVYKFIARESVEEKILALQERKRSLVEQIVSTETGGFFKSLTAGDIEALFS